MNEADEPADQEEDENSGNGSGEEESLFSDDFGDDDSDEDQDLAQVEDPGLVSMLNFALVEELSPDISKAVTLADCLEGFGKHWQGQITGGLGSTRQPQEKARQTKHIDDFISHDWSTNGTAKFITLCKLYNGRPAIGIAVVVSVAAGVLETFFEELRVLPGFFVLIGRQRMEVPSAGCFGLLGGICAYLMALCFWQRVQHLVCRRSRQVFMDRLCIEQNNPELKKRGIMGLAGFLKLSKRLVVLWSPRYFTRLWCVYELATWTKLRKSLRQIIIAPVAQGVFMLLVLCGVFVVMVVLTALAQVDNWELYAITLGLVTAAIMMAPLYAVRNLVCDLRVMKVQIEGFSFMSAECYCCRVDHTIPGTSTRIPCDRQIIGNKLEEWFGPQSSGVIRQGMAKELYLALAKSSTSGTTGESAQELFDRYVQEVFGHYIMKKVGGSRVSYSVAVATTLPAFFYICDRLHLLTTLALPELLRLSAHYFAVVLGFFPSLVRLALDLTLLADYLLQGRQLLAGNLAVMLFAMSLLAGITFFWLFLFDYTLFHDQVAFQMLMNSATLLVTAALYHNDLRDGCTSLRRFRKHARTNAPRPPLQRLKSMKTRKHLRLSRPEALESGAVQKCKSQPVPEAAAELPKPRQVTFGKTVPDFGTTLVLPGEPLT